MIEPIKRGDSELDELFAAYREACVVPDAGADFMPRLWERIEKGKKWTDALWHWANSLAAAAAVASLFFVLMQIMPGRTSGVTITRSYVELLAEQHEPEELDFQVVSWPTSRIPEAELQ